MTEQEAIEKLKCMRLFMQLNDKDNESKFSLEDYEANAMAIESINKQIAEEPYLEGDGYSDGEMVYDMWRCPNCEKLYEIDYDHYDYCPHCGQKLDWNRIGEEQ